MLNTESSCNLKLTTVNDEVDYNKPTVSTPQNELEEQLETCLSNATEMAEMLRQNTTERQLQD